MDELYYILMEFPLRKIIKNILDKIISLFALVVLSPLFIIIAALIKLDSNGPVLFMQERVGKNGRLFNSIKFRTMICQSIEKGLGLNIKNDDERITRAGKFLRTWSLDELPQLINVLKGDMSFVGPRPALFNQDDLIALRTKKGVHRLIPGITGWAQINGRDDIPIPQKVEFDDYYLNHRSFFFDLKILFLTFFRVTYAKNVSH